MVNGKNGKKQIYHYTITLPLQKSTIKIFYYHGRWSLRNGKETCVSRPETMVMGKGKETCAMLLERCQTTSSELQLSITTCETLLRIFSIAYTETRQYMLQ